VARTFPPSPLFFIPDLSQLFLSYIETPPFPSDLVFLATPPHFPNLFEAPLVPSSPGAPLERSHLFSRVSFLAAPFLFPSLLPRPPQFLTRHFLLLLFSLGPNVACCFFDPHEFPHPLATSSGTSLSVHARYVEAPPFVFPPPLGSSPCTRGSYLSGGFLVLPPVPAFLLFAGASSSCPTPLNHPSASYLV